jgi:hypothetical protein
VTRDSLAFRDRLVALGFRVLQVKEDRKVSKEKRVNLASLEHLVEMEDQEKMAPLDSKVKMFLFQRSLLEAMQDGMASEVK